MSIESKIIDILEDVLPVYSTQKHSINTNNGILNDEYLSYHKKAMLKKVIGYFSNELVNIKQGYPKNDLSEVEFSTDFIMIKRKEYTKLIDLIMTLVEESNKGKENE